MRSKANKPLYKDLEDIKVRIFAHPYIETRTIDNLGIRNVYEEWVRTQNGSLSSGMINILVAHGTTIDKSLHSSLIDAGYYYIALGHDHAIRKVNDKSWYAGSLQYWELKEAQDEKGYLIVEMKQGKAYPTVEASKVQATRPIILEEIPVEPNDTSTSIIQKVRRALDEKGLNTKYDYSTGARVRIRFSGQKLLGSLFSITEAESYLRRLALSSDDYNIVEFSTITPESPEYVEHPTHELTEKVGIEYLIADPEAEFKDYIKETRAEAIKKEGLDVELLTQIFAETIRGKQDEDSKA